MPRTIVFDHFDPHDERRREALFTLGNGVLSMRPAAPEAVATGLDGPHYAGLYRAGWYDEAPRFPDGKRVSVAALVNLPDPFGLTVGMDGTWFNLACVPVLAYRHWLDIDHAVACRHIVFRLAGRVLDIEERRFVSMTEPDVAILRCTAAFHLKRLTHESSLSKIVCAGALAHLDGARSWRYFREGLVTDLNAHPDAPTRDGIHLAAMAGAFDVLQRHYLGVRMRADGIHLFPAPPDSLPDAGLQVVYRGRRLAVTLSGDTVTLAMADDAPGPVRVVCESRREWLTPGRRMSVVCHRTG